MSRPPRPPAELDTTGRRLWRSVTSTYALETHQLELLRLACVSADRAEQARALITTDGPVIAAKEGPKPHPAVIIERDSTLRVARLIAALDLDVGDLPPAPLTPAQRAERARIGRGKG